MLHYKVRNMEWFKDGMVLGSRELKPGEILILDEATKNKVEQSGGVLEVLDTLIKNPLKDIEKLVEPIQPVVVVKNQEVSIEAMVEEPQPKRKAGRPKKHVG